MTEASNISYTELGNKVATRLASLPGVDTSALDAHLEGTTVVLAGSVDTIMSARKIVLAAETIDGVHDVENHLTLTGNADATGSRTH